MYALPIQNKVEQLHSCEKCFVSFPTWNELVRHQLMEQRKEYESYSKYYKWSRYLYKMRYLR
jgi:hypothetical protein